MFLVVAGASSAIGSGLLQALVEDERIERVLGLYRTKSAALERVARSLRDSGEATELFAWDASSDDSLGLVLERIDEGLARSDRLVFVYACGKWHSGEVASITRRELDEVVRLQFTAPALFLAELGRRLRQRRIAAKFVIVTGLGGEKTSVAYNSLYSATTSAIHNFARAFAMEIAGTASSVCCVALGLADKGQPYIHDLCSNLVTRKPTPLGDIVECLRFCVVEAPPALNGALLELSGGLFNYQDACRYFEARRRSTDV